VGKEAGVELLYGGTAVNDHDLLNWLMRTDGRSQSVNMIAAERIRELKRELNRANQRIGLFQHHASKKKAKR
jgi:hypothetical protein